jgi:CheY-like chemotaxis protein
MQAKPSGRSGTHLRPGRVLVIDDEQLLGDALRRTFSRDNQLVCVSSASEALALLERGKRYDVVLCDLMMPGMDGIEFHRRLSQKLPDEAARVVFITGGAVTARVEAFFNRVSNLLLEKPVDIDGLRALIERRVRGADANSRSA